jgi:acyl-ACP thioesterase
MNANPKSSISEFQINSLLVNPMGRLGLYGTLNAIQETSWTHAEAMGFGMADMERQGIYWVLTRQTLQMKIWPSFGKKLSVETWLRPPDGAFVMRDFLLRDAATQEEIGKCTTTWLALDRATSKILPAQNLRPWEEICDTRSTGLIADKIPVQGQYEKLAKFRVRNSDLDINQHVNNTKYSQWILDAIPYELHKTLKLTEYSVNFLAETHLGDKVEIERSLHTESGALQGSASYRGLRLSDEKVLFTAKLAWEQKNP